MKNLKRVLALVTVLSMLMSVNAFADDEVSGGEPEATPVVEVTIVVTPPGEAETDDETTTEPETSVSDETPAETSEETDEPETVMDIVEDIHGKIENAESGSTVTITVGDGEGTLVNNGEGVLEAWAEEKCKNNPTKETTEIIKARRALGDDPEELFNQYYGGDPNAQYEYWKNNKIKSIANWNEASEEKLENSEAFANGKIDSYLVGQNILLVPNDGTVAVTTIGTLESDGRFNNTIAGTTGSNGTLIINGGTYVGDTDEKGSYVINVAGGTVEVKEGNFSGAILVTGTIIRDSDNQTILSGGTLKINGGTFTDYTIQNDRAQQWANSANTLIKGYTGSDGAVLISGGSFDSVATLKDGFLTDGIVLVENLNSDNMYTAVARSSLVDTYDLTAHETEGQATYYTITLKVVNEETGEEEIIEAPVYFYDDSSDDSDDSSDEPVVETPAPVTIEEEATPLAALPEAFTADDVASLAVDLGLAESVESYDFVAETTAETVSSVIESLTAGNENADAAAILADAGITPESVVSREQFATVIYALAGTAGFDRTARADLAEKFTDADAVSAFAQEALEWAVEAGIYRGTSQTTLDPKSTLTYDQLILVVSRYLAMLNAQ